VKVHFAAGTHPFKKPWRNVDFEGHQPGITDQADLLDGIPEQLTGITDAYVGHFLEHLTKDEGVKFLWRVLQRMAPGGRLVVVGPDARKGEQWHGAGKLSAEMLAAIKAHGSIPEDQPHARGAVHLWDCTGQAVVDLANAAGWVGVREFPIREMPRVTPGVPVISDAGWQFAVLAYAGADMSRH
jgi:hypothetical protein